MTTITEITPTEQADRLAIRELIDAYAHCADRRDAEGQKALFTENTHKPIGAPGFEPGTSPTRTVRATRLRHAPTQWEYSTRLRGLPGVAMPASINEILEELDRLLEPERFEDYGPNGLQVPGPSEVSAVASSVSAHVELFELAAAERVQLLIVHHGLVWGPGIQVIDAALKRRLQLLFEADIGLAAYHLPLDAHPELGNNALLARALGAQELSRFARHHGEPIGILAHLPGEGVPAAELFERVQQITGHETLVFDSGPERVRLLAIVSGAGSDF